MRPDDCSSTAPNFEPITVDNTYPTKPFKKKKKANYGATKPEEGFTVNDITLRGSKP